MRIVNQSKMCYTEGNWRRKSQGGCPLFDTADDEADLVKSLALKKLLETANAATLLAQFAKLTSESVTLVIFDQQGRVLASYPPLQDNSLIQGALTVCRTGQPLVDNDCRALPIWAEDQLMGGVAGAPPSIPGLGTLLDSLLSVIDMLVVQAIERKSLAQELLDRYREINLLYRLHETIGTSIDLNQVAARALTESVRIAKANSGTLFLYDETTKRLHPLVTEGNEPKLCDGQGIPQWVAQEGRSAIVNDVSSDPRYTIGGNSTESLAQTVWPPPDEAQAEGLPISTLQSLLCVPLKVREKVLGVLCLCNKQRGGIFTAGDEKLFMALASQTAAAIENARQVAARERQLRRQIQELRIEVDQVRKRQEVKKIIDSDYFRHLAETAQQWREDLEQE